MQFPPPYGGPPRPPFPGVGGPPQGGLPFGGRIAPQRPQLIVRPIGGTATPSLGPVIKKTTLYVGKIAATVKDETMEQLLAACGALRSWKHMRDPETDKSKGFGFAEFEEAEGVIRAMRILHNLEIDGQSLMVKPDTATQRYLNDYTSSQNDGGEGNKDETNDDEALAKVMELVSSLAADKAAADKAAKDFLANTLPTEATESKEPIANSPSRVSEGSRRARSSDRARDRSRERSRDRRSRDDRLDRAYKERLSVWERHERENLQLVDREKDREKRQAQDRERLIKNEFKIDGEVPVEMWKRKPYKGSRRAEDRKRRREREEQEDNEDREQERSDKKRKQEEAEQAALAPPPEPQENGTASPAPATTPVPTVNPDDPIYQAMMAAAKERPKAAAAAEPAEEVLPPPPIKQEPVVVKQEGPLAGAPQAPARKPGRKPAVVAAFAEDDEEEKQPRRAPKPIQYTEEEIRAVQDAKPRTENATADVKSIADSIPTSRDAVFAYAVDWNSYDAAGKTLEQKVTEWVGRKVKELMGEEEASLVQFVVGNLQKHVAAKDMLSELTDLFEAEAEVFVLKLYRFVIFETKKFALLGSN